MEQMRILLIGTGRLAFHLGHAMRRAGIDLVGVVGRDPEHTRTLAEELKCPAFGFGDPLPAADLRIIAVRDDAIQEVAARLPKIDTPTVHTGGSREWTLIEGHAHRGVLWPVQSLSPGAPADFATIPLVIDAEDEVASAPLRQLAGKVSNVVHELGHARRQWLHLAAVFASNFPVLLLLEAEQLLQREGLPSELITPLWSTTTAKAAHNAAQALTGPARRGDMRTIAAHLSRLRGDPDLRRAYALLSDLILKIHHPDLRRAPEDLQGDPR